MKKKILLSFVLLAIAGTSIVFAQGSSINGKWYVRAGNDSAELYDFRSDGTLLVAGDSYGITYRVSGSTITTMYSGVTMGTAAFSVSGSGSSARLTISRASENSGLENGTYYFSSSASSPNINSAITGKWYVRVANASAEIYDFRSNGTLLVNGESQGVTYTVSGNTITTMYSGITMGTATFAVSGTGNSARLTISRASENSGLVNGTYYKN